MIGREQARIWERDLFPPVEKFAESVCPTGEQPVMIKTRATDCKYR